MGRITRPGEPAANVGQHCYPLWSLVAQGPEAGRLWLPGVRTYVYTVRGSRYRGDPHVFRRGRMMEMLERLGWRDWQWTWGTRCEPYWRGIACDHARLLRENEPPLLILEDDCEIREWRANIEAPAEAEVLQLGGGRGGDRRGIYAARLAGLDPIDCYRYAYLPVDTQWMRVFGMWFCHAVLWLDLGVMREAADLLARLGEMVDGVYAISQWRWNWYCRRVPIWWQNDGHHYRDTYEYQPRALRGRRARLISAGPTG